VRVDYSKGLATCSATSGDIVVMQVEIDTPPSFPAYVCVDGNLDLGCTLTPAGITGGTFTWSKVTGPGNVPFTPNGTAGADDTVFSADTAGTYTVKVEHTKEGVSCGDASGNIVVMQVEIKNSTNPNKGQSNDSDDFFFRGPSEPDVKVYYDFLPSGLTADSVKLLIKEGGQTLREISLSTSSGTNLLAEWDGKDGSGDCYDKWDFRAIIQVIINGTTCTSGEQQIQELLYKHRPLIYIHADEFCGPNTVSLMLVHSDLYERGEEDPVEDEPLYFDDLSSHNSTAHYQDLDNDYRESDTGPDYIYCRGTVQSGHAFLQYYHFESGSTGPDLSLWIYRHEGDWEMFQIAVKLDTEAEELKPIAVTGVSTTMAGRFAGSRLTATTGPTVRIRITLQRRGTSRWYTLPTKRTPHTFGTAGSNRVQAARTTETSMKRRQSLCSLMTRQAQRPILTLSGYSTTV